MRYLTGYIFSVTMVSMVCSAWAQDTADIVTYQGRLTSASMPIDDNCDMEFQVWDSENGGNPIGGLESIADVPVVNSEFTVMIDFDPDVFAGGNRWFEIGVRCPAGAGDFTTLAPRQRVTVAPRASALELPAEMVGVVSGRGAVTIENRALSNGSFALHGIIDTDSDGAAAIRGENRGVGFSGPGVWGSNESGGIGVLGESVSGAGVSGVSDTGTGVFASTSGSGQQAIYGRNDGSGGFGMIGEHLESTGFGVGVLGRSTNSPDGTGVSGVHNAVTGTGAGVHGLTNSASANAVGVLGEVNVLVPGQFSAAVKGQHSSGSANGIGVWGNHDSSGWGVYGSADSGRGVYGHATSSAGVNYGVYGRTESASGFSFFAAGPGTDYGSSSSIRWKRNIAPIDDALDRVSRLNGVFFDWDEAHGGHHDVGMIAENVGQVLPEVVQYEENGVDAIGMDYSRLAPLLIEAVKALKQKNENLHARMTQMENRLAEFERSKGLAQSDSE